MAHLNRDTTRHGQRRREGIKGMQLPHFTLNLTCCAPDKRTLQALRGDNHLGGKRKRAGGKRRNDENPNHGRHFQKRGLVPPLSSISVASGVCGRV